LKIYQAVAAALLTKSLLSSIFVTKLSNYVRTTREFAKYGLVKIFFFGFDQEIFSVVKFFWFSFSKILFVSQGARRVAADEANRTAK
jgi:hypothetical protein